MTLQRCSAQCRLSHANPHACSAAQPWFPHKWVYAQYVCLDNATHIYSLATTVLSEELATVCSYGTAWKHQAPHSGSENEDVSKGQSGSSLSLNLP